MKAKDVKVDIKELKKFKVKNAEERLKFIDFLTEYIKSHKDEEWGRQQKELIDSQF